MLTVVSFALLASLFFASSNVAVKIGLKNSNSISATFITLIINVIFLWVLSIFLVPFHVFTNKGIIFFAIGGIFAPCLGRIFFYTGIERVGVSIASPIKTTSPLFAAMIAVLILSEHFTMPIGIATILGITGVMIFTSTSTDNTPMTTMRWEKKDLIFPLISAIFYGTSRIFRKMGIDIVNSSVCGATVATTISLIFFAIILTLTGKRQRIVVDKKNFLFFSIGGIFGGIAQICIINALKWGEVIVVSPLSTPTQPLFVLLLTFLFLKKSKRITFRVLIGAIFIIVGVMLLTILS